MNATEQLHAFQERTESLRQMVETRDLIIADLEREIRDIQRANRELRAALNGTLVPEQQTCWQTRGQ
jgi:hypothetical protein